MRLPVLDTFTAVSLKVCGGLISTARDYLRFSQMLLNGGEPMVYAYCRQKLFN